MTAGQYAYRKVFLKSEFWRHLRADRHRLVREMYGDTVCECCMVPIEDNWRNGHHVVYPDDWYSTEVDEIRIICVPCHQFIHLMISEGRLLRFGTVEQLWEKTLELAKWQRQQRWKEWEIKLARREKLRIRKAEREAAKGCYAG